MTANADRLYNLLPVVYRLRDADQGYPLRALLQVISEQVNVVDADIAQLYENWFIETCQDWVVPYIGGLIGYTPVEDAAQLGSVTTKRGVSRERVLIPRQEVANTIRYRRRKGTLRLLEDLARSVAGWPAHAVEFYRSLGVAQNIDYLHIDRGRTADIRDGVALEHLGGPFDMQARTVEVRRVDSQHSQGRYNIPSVGVFVWRLPVYSVTQAPAYCYEEENPNCFLFSALGNDVPLYNSPQPAQPSLGYNATEVNFPAPIRRLSARAGSNRGRGCALSIRRSTVLRRGEELRNLGRIVEPAGSARSNRGCRLERVDICPSAWTSGRRSRVGADCASTESGAQAGSLGHVQLRL